MHNVFGDTQHIYNNTNVYGFLFVSQEHLFWEVYFSRWFYQPKAKQTKLNGKAPNGVKDTYEFTGSNSVDLASIFTFRGARVVSMCCVALRYLNGCYLLSYVARTVVFVSISVSLMSFDCFVPFCYMHHNKLKYILGTIIPNSFMDLKLN